MGHFLEAAGSVLSGQMEGQRQGQQELARQKDENFRNQIEAVNLRRQIEAANQAQTDKEREDAYRYALPNIRPDQRAAAAEHIMGQRPALFAGIPGLQIPTDRAYAGVPQILAPQSAPAAPHPLSQAMSDTGAAAWGGVRPGAQPPDQGLANVAQEAMLHALRGGAALLPGGQHVLGALQMPAPQQPAVQPPGGAPSAPAPVPSPTVHLFGKEFAANVIDPKAWARLQGDYGKITKDLEGVTDPTVLANAHISLRNWNPNPATVEDFQGNEKVIQDLRDQGLGSGHQAEAFREGQFKTDVAGYNKRSTALQTASPEAAVALLPSLLRQEDALIQRQGDRDAVAPTFGLWRSDIEKIDAFTQTSQRATAASREAVAAGRTEDAAQLTAKADAAQKEATRLSGIMQGRLRGQMKPSDEIKVEKQVQNIISHWSYTNANNPALTRPLYEKRGLKYLSDSMTDDQMRFGQARAQKDVRELTEKIASPGFAQVNKATQQVDLKLLFDAQRAAGVKNPAQLSEVTAKLPPGMRERLDLMHRNANRADAEFTYRQKRDQTADRLKTTKQGLLSVEDKFNFHQASEMFIKVVTDPLGGTSYAYPDADRNRLLPTLEALGRKGKMDLRYLGLGDYREVSPTAAPPAARPQSPPRGGKAVTGALMQGLQKQPAATPSRGTPAKGPPPQRLPNAARLQMISMLLQRIDPETGQPMTRARAEQLASRHR